MKSKIMLTVTHAEFPETGHEIEDLTILKGCTVVDVTDTDGHVCLTVEHCDPQA